MPGGTGTGAPALRVTGLSKTFPGTRALDGVSIEVEPGHVHALLGGNGSGKSTLIKVLAGVHRGDPGGELAVGDAVVASDRTSPTWARAAGVHFVHQDPGVFPTMTVAENMAIGRGFETSRAGAIRWKALRRRTVGLLERFQIRATPDTPVGLLRPADRTMVAIARALQDQEGEHEGVLVLDEPTASLPASEVDVLLAAIRRYAVAGQTIVFVTHRLDEVIAIADRVSVLRDGRHVGTVDVAGRTESDLVEMIFGRPLDEVLPETEPAGARERALEVRGLVAGPLRGVDLVLGRGEVLGVAGLLGSGRTELLTAIFGAMPIAAGEVLLDGRPVRFASVDQAMDAGLGYIPEDRAAEAAFPEMSLRENLSAGQVRRYWRGLRHRHGAEAADARGSIAEYGIRASGDQQPFSTLSGGNQQKAVLARWLRRTPRVLLLDEPTQGVDVSARAEIYAVVRAAVERGTSVIVVTSDFEELARVCDRVVVLAGGRIVAELSGTEMAPHRMTDLAFASTDARRADEPRAADTPSEVAR
ncbi:sugar ABC transporter ATP-binding protein [Pseudonocardia lacus]|uniref:sugar ABC transporter ATP-binding protein n=1 Tax=Pseudonocardia lacus TaxID=2835865 RepID=UPI001BDCC59F|nr:sugar ABC transporter ATP-binding protein [Pseudonocardia lacus]